MSPNPKPGLFLTDDDGALTAALQLKFPNVPHVRCNWHIRNNFCTRVLQHVSRNGEEDTYQEIISAVDNMLWKRRTGEFDDAVKEYEAKVLKHVPMMKTERTILLTVSKIVKDITCKNKNKKKRSSFVNIINYIW